MILVDTSIWIDLLNGRRGRALGPDELVEFATCVPILQELWQGLKEDPRTADLRDALLALPCLGNPLPRDTYLHAADIYRQGRRIGYAIRSSVDCLIAAIAIENRVPVWHRDRDFDAIARYTDLAAA